MMEKVDFLKNHIYGLNLFFPPFKEQDVCVCVNKV